MPIDTRKPRFNRTALLGTALGAALLAGCTTVSPSPSIVSWSNLSEDEAALGTVVIGVPEGLELPQGFLDELAAGTELSIIQQTISPSASGAQAKTSDKVTANLSGIDFLMGGDETWLQSGVVKDLNVDLSADRVVQYGSDDACVLVDSSWYSANNVTLPTSLAEIVPKQLESIVAASNPSLSPYAFALLPKWSTRWASWTSASSEAAGDAQSSSQDEAEPSLVPAGFVGSALEPVRNPNNLGTDTRYRVIADSCVQREAALLDLRSESGGNAEEPDAFKQLGSLLTSEQGQAMIARHGVAFPLGLNPGEADAEGQTRPLSAPAASAAESLANLTKWQEAFGH